MIGPPLKKQAECTKGFYPRFYLSFRWLSTRKSAARIEECCTSGSPGSGAERFLPPGLACAEARRGAGAGFFGTF